MIEAELADGTILEFPDGTSPDVIKRVVKARSGATQAPQGAQPPAQAAAAAPAPSEPAQSNPWSPEVIAQAAAAEEQNRKSSLAGTQDSLIKMGLGVKQLFGGLSDENKAMLKEMEADAAADANPTARTRAGVVTNVATTALPAAGAATKVAGVTSVLPQALRFAAPAATAAAVSGGQGALLNIGEGDTYGEQMLDKGKKASVDAAWGAGFAGGGQVLKKALTKPVQATVEAIRLMRQGITPTLQQGAEGSIARFVGGLTSGAVDVKKRQNREVMEALLKRIAPDVDTAGMTVPEQVSLLKQHFLGDKATKTLGAYGELFDGKKFVMTPASRSAIWKEARGEPGMQDQARSMSLKAMGGTGRAMTSSNSVRMGSDKMAEYRELMEDAINSFNPKNGVMEKQAQQALIKARKQFDVLVRNKQLNADELAKLADLDQRYSDFLRFQEAAKSPGFHAQPKVSDVMRAEANMAKGTSFAEGRNPTQRELLEPAARTMGMTPTQDEARSLISAAKRAGKVLATGAVGAGAAASNPIGLALAPAYAVSLAGQTKPGARILFGETNLQKKLAEIMREAAPYGAGLGQSLTGD